MIEFNNIETLTNWLAWKYFKGRLNWPTDKVAREMHVNEHELIEWVNRRGSAMSAVERGQVGDAKRIMDEFEAQYPPEVPDPEALPDIKLNDVVKLMKEDKTLGEIAHSVRCPIDTFRRWWTANLPLINAQLRKL
jgi:hypothetical protein